VAAYERWDAVSFTLELAFYILFVLAFFGGIDILYIPSAALLVLVVWARRNRHKAKRENNRWN